jgi:aryl-alcohol dehydrogenase
VAKVGSNVASIDVGDHVLITYTCCGDCKYCMSKETSFCREWEQANFGVGRKDGSKAFSAKSNGDKITSHFFGQSSFARYAIVMARSIVKVDKDLPLEKLAPLGCGIMTGAGGMYGKIFPIEQGG